MQRPRRLQPFVRPSSSSNSNCFPLLFLILIRSFGSSAILLPVSFSTMYPNALAPDQTSRFRSFDLHVRIRHELEKFIFLMAEGSPAPLLESLELRVQRCTASDTVFYFLILPYDLHTCTPSGSHRDSRMATPKTFSTTPKHNLVHGRQHLDSMSSDTILIHEIISFLSFTPSI